VRRFLLDAEEEEPALKRGGAEWMRPRSFAASVAEVIAVAVEEAEPAGEAVLPAEKEEGRERERGMRGCDAEVGRYGR
jgi:hypothetical protein